MSLLKSGAAYAAVSLRKEIQSATADIVAASYTDAVKAKLQSLKCILDRDELSRPCSPSAG